jgi:hypothetical protein
MDPKTEEVIEDRGDEFTPTEEEGSLVLTDDLDLDPATKAALLGKDEKPGESDAGDVEEGDAPAKKGGSIPKDRFDDVNAKRKAAEEELADLRNRLKALEEGGKPADPEPKEEPADPRAKLKELRAARKTALDDGELDEFDRLDAEIQEELVRIARAEFSQEQDTKSSQQKVSEAMTAIAQDAYVAYPFLDVSKEGYDVDAVNAVTARRNELYAQGKSLPDALKQAVEEKGPRFAVLNGVTVDKTAADKLRADRKSAEVQKRASASVSQPADLKGGDGEPVRVDVSKLSDAEFRKLPESVKARARGDIV